MREGEIDTAGGAPPAVREAARSARLREAPRWPAAMGLREAGDSLRERPAGSGWRAGGPQPAREWAIGNGESIERA